MSLGPSQERLGKNSVLHKAVENLLLVLSQPCVHSTVCPLILVCCKSNKRSSYVLQLLVPFANSTPTGSPDVVVVVVVVMGLLCTCALLLITTSAEATVRAPMAACSAPVPMKSPSLSAPQVTVTGLSSGHCTSTPQNSAMTFTTK